MNIGMICYPTYGGSGVVATELGLALGRRGHQVHFITYGMPFRLSNGFCENVFYHEVNTSDYPLFQHPLYTAALAARAATLVESEGLDIIHAHYAIPHAIAAYLAREMALPRQVKVITTTHGTDVTLVGRSEAFAPLVKMSLERSDAVTTVSHWLRDISIERFGVTRPIDVIHNFVDGERFQRLEGPCPCGRQETCDHKVLLHMSNFRPVKRVGDVIRIFARVHEEIPSILLMIGEGPEQDAASKLARELGVCGYVRFLGKQNAIEQYLGKSDLFLMPSDHESFGLAALEAMTCETPVVGSRSGGMPEVIEDGITGALEAVGDVEAMARRSIEILKDDDARREMGRAGRRRALERFSVDAIVAQYEKLYERTLAGAGRP